MSMGSEFAVGIATPENVAVVGLYVLDPIVGPERSKPEVPVRPFHNAKGTEIEGVIGISEIRVGCRVDRRNLVRSLVR